MIQMPEDPSSLSDDELERRLLGQLIGKYRRKLTALVAVLHVDDFIVLEHRFVLMSIKKEHGLELDELDEDRFAIWWSKQTGIPWLAASATHVCDPSQLARNLMARSMRRNVLLVGNEFLADDEFVEAMDEFESGVTTLIARWRECVRILDAFEDGV